MPNIFTCKSKYFRQKMFFSQFFDREHNVTRYQKREGEPSFEIKNIAKQNRTMQVFSKNESGKNETMV